MPPLGCDFAELGLDCRARKPPVHTHTGCLFTIAQAMRRELIRETLVPLTASVATLTSAIRDLTQALLRD